MGGKAKDRWRQNKELQLYIFDCMWHTGHKLCQLCILVLIYIHIWMSSIIAFELNGQMNLVSTEKDFGISAAGLIANA